jgi:hypothetical protein
VRIPKINDKFLIIWQTGRVDLAVPVILEGVVVKGFWAVLFGIVSCFVVFSEANAAQSQSSRTYESAYRNTKSLGECRILRNNNAQRRIYGAAEVPLPSYCGGSAAPAPAAAPSGVTMATQAVYPLPSNVGLVNPNSGLTGGPYISTGASGSVTSIPYTAKPDVGSKVSAMTLRGEDGGTLQTAVKTWISTTPGGSFESADPSCRSDRAGKQTILTGGLAGSCPIVPGGLYYYNVQGTLPTVFAIKEGSGFYSHR